MDDFPNYNPCPLVLLILTEPIVKARLLDFFKQRLLPFPRLGLLFGQFAEMSGLGLFPNPIFAKRGSRGPAPASFSSRLPGAGIFVGEEIRGSHQVGGNIYIYIYMYIYIYIFED